MCCLLFHWGTGDAARTLLSFLRKLTLLPANGDRHENPEDDKHEAENEGNVERKRISDEEGYARREQPSPGAEAHDDHAQPEGQLDGGETSDRRHELFLPARDHGTPEVAMGPQSNVTRAAGSCGSASRIDENLLSHCGD